MQLMQTYKCYNFIDRPCANIPIGNYGVPSAQGVPHASNHIYSGKPGAGMQV